MRGGSAYWANVSKKLSNIVENLPAPTIFFTFSFSGIYTSDISDLIFDNSPFPIAASIFSDKGFIGPLTQTQLLGDLLFRMRIVADNPHVAVEVFDRKIKNMITIWLKGILGCDWIFCRVEMQNRGSLHVHGLERLKDDPGLIKLTESFKRTNIHLMKNFPSINFVSMRIVPSFEETVVNIDSTIIMDIYMGH